jgi:hypothetical protein
MSTDDVFMKEGGRHVKLTTHLHLVLRFRRWSYNCTPIRLHTVEINLVKFRGNFTSLIHMPAGNSNILTKHFYSVRFLV